MTRPAYRLPTCRCRVLRIRSRQTPCVDRGDGSRAPPPLGKQLAMSNWIRVATTLELPPGANRELVVDDRIVALFNVDGEYVALDGVCPHQGGPLGKGTLAGCIVTCPWHGWQFDVRNGQHQASASLKHLSFPVKVEQDEIFVDVDS
jgi:nitrite reductase (NADH) small subunit